MNEHEIENNITVLDAKVYDVTESLEYISDKLDDIQSTCVDKTDHEALTAHVWDLENRLKDLEFKFKTTQANNSRFLNALERFPEASRWEYEMSKYPGSFKALSSGELPLGETCFNIHGGKACEYCHSEDCEWKYVVV